MKSELISSRREENIPGQGNARCKVPREKGTWNVLGTERWPEWLNYNRGESD